MMYSLTLHIKTIGHSCVDDMFCYFPHHDRIDKSPSNIFKFCEFNDPENQTTYACTNKIDF